MLNRIVSLALIVCFLPLPNIDSAGARDLMIGLSITNLVDQKLATAKAVNLAQK